ncbi:MAG: hypothetical protein IVW52_02990 [Acidimicrobiales bacterium]|nr:hypothetical protein [Acidimicrobiales bacterium]
MFKLARMHLDSVGSDAARFSGLTLDFTDDEHNPLDTIIWLRNGGGKTSLLSLLFSLFLPYRRDFLGYREDRRTLGDYVLSGDTSHVLCEWDTPSGPLVTGAVYEWPDRRRPLEHEKHAGELQTRFYAFNPKASVLTFDERPARDEVGRRRPLDAYVRELRSLGRSHPLTNLAVANTGTEWNHALLGRGIDPAIFKYQKEMNKGEGAIDEQFRFATGEAFVNFLIEMAVDAEASESVSDRMTQLAGKLAARPRTEQELAYCEGVAERLGPIASRWADLGRQRIEVDEASIASQRLAGGLRAASALAANAEQGAETTKSEASLRRTAAETARTTARDRAREYTRRAAAFWVQDATARLAQIKEERQTVEEERAGWGAVVHLLEFERAQSVIEDIDRQLADKTKEGEPLRLARNVAARRLHWRYRAQRELVNAERSEADERARGHDADAEGQEEDARQARQENGRLEGVIGGLAKEIAAIDKTVTEAIDARHLGLGEDVPAAVARAEQGESTAAAAIERLEAGVNQRMQRQQQLVTDLTALGAKITQLTAVRDAAAAEHERLDGQAVAFGAHERVRELAQSDHVSIWGAHQMLDARLSEELQRAEDTLVAEEVGAERDRRNRDALGEGGLLPPSLDTEAMLAVLAAAGVSAISGLAYLSSSVSRRHWEATIDAHPGLLSGILVDAGDFERSRTALIDAGLHPASLVTVARKSDLDGEGETAFVVPPSPALYDPAQADEERKALDERLGGLDRRKAVLAAGINADRDLRGDLRRFIETCPVGHLDALARRIGEHDRALHDLDERKAEFDAEGADISAFLAEAATSRIELSAERLTAHSRVGVLSALAAQVTRRPGLEADREQAAADQAIARKRAAEMTDAAAESRRLATASRAQIAALDNRISQLDSSLATVELRGSGEWGTEDGEGPNSGTSTEELERELASRDEQYRGAVSDPVLEDRRSRAVTDRTSAQTRLNHQGDSAISRANELRHEPAASDSESRAARVAALDSRHRALLTEGGEANVDLTAAQTRLREHTPADRQVYRELAESELPTDRADAEHRQGEEEAEATRQQGIVSEAERMIAEAVIRSNAAKARKELLSVLADGLDNLITPDEQIQRITEEPFVGSDEEARAAQSESNARLRSATERSNTTEAHLNKGVTDLRAFATRADFESAGSLREPVIVGEIADVGRRAAELTDAHETRAAVLRNDLAAISADQQILVTDLSDQVRRVLDLLKKAPQTSIMHPSLGEWANKSFLTISFDDVTSQADEMARRVSAEIDVIVAKGDAPDGLVTLQKAVHAAVPGGFKVRVLKPTADLHEERVQVSAMSKWSGGEKLTAAVVLYCIIARLRARNRSRELSVGTSGALMLDNPLGKSNYVGFLAVQRRVAEALGVQLLYTTGVRDLKAVGTFPNVIRCRNRRAASTDRGYVTAAERAGEAHGTSLEGMVSSARVVRLDPTPVLVREDIDGASPNEGGPANHGIA